MKLTKKRNGKNVIPLLNAVCGIDMPYWRIDRADNLHSYLSGDATDKLAAYEDAEEQGRLVILPCKVGDTFFFLSETIHGELYVAQSRVSNIVMTGDVLIIVDTDGCYHVAYWFTRKEAEAALKRGQDNV